MKGKSKILICSGAILVIIVLFLVIFLNSKDENINNKLPEFVVDNGVLTQYNGNEKNIIIPDDIGILSIEEQVFKGNTDIVSIQIPEGVTSIRGKAFYECTSLEEIHFPDSLAKLDFTIVGKCKRLKEIKVPSGVSLIVIDTFLIPGLSGDELENFWLEDIYVDENNAVYSSQDGILYNKDKTKKIFCPPSNKSNKEIAETTKSITDSSEFVVENGVLVEYNGSGGNVVIPNDLGIKSIGEEVFYLNESITSVVVPEGVTTIMSRAFNECNNLSSVTLPNTLTELDYSSFGLNISLKNIKVPSGVTNILLQHPHSMSATDTQLAFPGFERVEVDENNQVYSSIDGVVYSKDMKKLLYFPIEKIGEFAFPTETNEIADYAFYATSLKLIIISKEIKLIGEGAFLSSKLDSIIFQGEVFEIGEIAFSSCDYLESIELPNGLKSISNNLFENTMLERVILPEGLEIIGEKAFFYCPLEEVTLPNSLKRIEKAAFYECFFEEVTIPESVEYINADAFGIHYAWETPKTGATYLERIYCVKGSVADMFAKKNMVDTHYIDVD